MRSPRVDRIALQGELYWLPQAALHPGLPDGEAHPYVIVSADVFNRSRLDHVVVCALTTRLRCANEPGAVLLEPGEGDLPKQSVVMPTQICRVAKADLGDPIGKLSPERVSRILDGLRFVQRLTAR